MTDSLPLIGAAFVTGLLCLGGPIAAQQPPLAQVREAVLARWRETQSDEVLAKMITNLQAQYTVDLDELSLVEFEYSPEPMVEAQ